LWHLRAGDGSRVTSHHDAGERKAQLVMADRFRLEKVRARTGAQPEALPGPRVERPRAVPEAVAEALATDPAAGLTAEEVATACNGLAPRTGRAGARQVPLGQGEDTVALRPRAGRQREASTAPSGSGWRSGWPACSSCCG
jgi:hypothetical protein